MLHICYNIYNNVDGGRHSIKGRFLMVLKCKKLGKTCLSILLAVVCLTTSLLFFQINAKADNIVRVGIVEVVGNLNFRSGAGTENPVINFAQLTQRAGNFVVAREPIEGFTWDLLKGQEVLGGRAGGMPQMVFEYVLKKHGMDPKTDLSIDQSIDFGSTAAAFSGGKGAFTIEFEPHATSLETQKEGYIVASLGEESGYVPYTAFSATKHYIEENPEVVQAFVNALQKGLDYVNSHTPEEIAKIIAPQFKETDAKTIETIVTRYYDQDTWPTDLVFKAESFELLQHILMEAGELKEKVSYEALVDTTFAESATK